MKIHFDLASIYALLLSVAEPQNEEWDLMSKKFGHYYRDFDPHKMIPVKVPSKWGPTSNDVNAWKLKLNLKKL